MKSAVPGLELRSFGTSELRREDLRLLTGRGRYIADLNVAPMGHVAIYRSPFAHARIARIDTTAARALPGVHLVWTGQDVAPRAPGIHVAMEIEGFKPTLQPVLATDIARFVGEGVAVVVAESRHIAEDALDLIEIDFEELPPVLDSDAGRQGGPLANETLTDNIYHAQATGTGSVAEGAVEVRKVFTPSRVAGCPMEGRGCAADFDWTSGRLTLWSSTQMPGFFKSILALSLNVPEHNLTLITPDVGGGFGVKAVLYPEELLVCVLAMELNRPVQWIEDRREHFLSTVHAKHQVHDMTLSVASDGTFIGIRDRVYSDGGAYHCLPWSALIEPRVGHATLCGVYRVPAVDASYEAVATNKVPVGGYRGVGWTVPNMCREALVDEAARRVGLSPFEIRRRNVVREEDFPYEAPIGVTLREGSYLESLEALERAVDYPSFVERQRAARAEGRLLGLGISLFNEMGGFGTRALAEVGFPVSTFDTSTVRLEPTGKVVVTTSVVSQGQGHATTMAQIAADAFGVPMADVVVHAGNTDHAYGFGTWGSRAAVIGAGSILRAAEVVRERVRQAAAHMMEASPADIVFEDGNVGVRGTPTASMPLAQVTGAIYFAEQTHPPDFEPSLEATAAFDPAQTVLANGGHAAILEIDPETGFVHIEKIIAVEDCGPMINPMIVEGQIRGGIAQAIGMMLYEEIVFDDRGQPLTTSLMDYLVPTAREIPPIEIVHLENPSQFTPAGIKGLGESAMVSLPGAIMNAVNDALAPLGAFIGRVPITPERLVEAISSAPGSGRG
jgi:carbon-monoxide dehydrogenase large subunit